MEYFQVLVFESWVAHFILKKDPHSSLSKNNTLPCWKHVLVYYSKSCKQNLSPEC